MKRYKTEPGKRLLVLGQWITDAEAGVPLPDTPGVREHVTLGRLLPAKRTETATTTQDETPTRPLRRKRKEDTQ